MKVSLAAVIEQMKAEIMDDVRADIVPANVASFGDLHDFADANCYGGFCDEFACNALITYFGGRDENEGMPDALMAYINDAQEGIDAWIKQGGINAALAEVK